jgi:hypothetical protein
MNRKQKIVLWIGIVIIVLMCLFPPWVRVIEIEGSRLVSSPFYEFPWDYDYNHFLSPPKPLMTINRLFDLQDKNFPFEYESEYGDRFNEVDLSEQSFGVDSVRVDLQRLSIQCAIVALITVGLLCTFTTKAKYEHKEQKSRD